ncbi:MAG: IscS subfamily cysteine desulfurase [Candidatus Omnitrophica bacterium]|nr:IscS subfamily cysteine desulfurase [Candidatus Omnitrophota bacterium]
MKNPKIYLDNNATTPLHPEVKKALVEAMEVFGNPSSMHEFGREAKTLLDSAREKVSSFIGANIDEVVFVGSGSEANNTVLSMLACPSKHCCSFQSASKKIITTKIEHPCVFETAKCLRDRGIEVDFLDVDEYGKINIEQYKEILLRGGVSLVSIMTANNEIGTIQDIKMLCHLAHKHGSLFHTDAVQAVGKIPIDVNDLNVDFLTLSGHKIYGPKGIGALYVKKGISFCPLIRGGHQEKGRRAGTENVLGIIGLGKAVEMRSKEMAEEEKRLLRLKNLLKHGIEKSIPDIHFNGHPDDCLAGTLNVSFSGAEGEAILLYLDMEGISVSTGSACSSGSLDPSHVLLATGVGAEQAHGSIRISLGRETTQKEIEYLLEVFPKIINKIREMSTAYVRKDK